MTDDHFSPSWRRWRAGVDLDEYDDRWDRMAAAGASVHGEADFVDELAAAVSARSVLDAGCGTGRVAVELAGRGWRAVGVDNDLDMLARARRKPTEVRWIEANLATVELDEHFDVIVMAGNILPYARPADRAELVSNLGRHLVPGGALVNGSSIVAGCELGTVDRWASAAGLVVEVRYAGWGREPYVDGGDYAVTVYRRT